MSESSGFSDMCRSIGVAVKERIEAENQERTPGRVQNREDLCEIWVYSEDAHLLASFPYSDIGNGPQTSAEAEANARLFAAAPELLEALEKAKNHLDVVLSGVNEGVKRSGREMDEKHRAAYEMLLQTIFEAEAAIEKARGGHF